jgi:hypothetical protein
MSLALPSPSHAGFSPINTSPLRSPANDYRTKQGSASSEPCRPRASSEPVCPVSPTRDSQPTSARGLTHRRQRRKAYRKYRGPYPSRESEDRTSNLPRSRCSKPVCEVGSQQQAQCLDDEAAAKTVEDAPSPVDADGKGTTRMSQYL